MPYGSRAQPVLAKRPDERRALYPDAMRIA